jgi:hypothetical protein
MISSRYCTHLQFTSSFSLLFGVVFLRYFILPIVCASRKTREHFNGTYHGHGAAPQIREETRRGRDYIDCHAANVVPCNPQPPSQQC